MAVRVDGRLKRLVWDSGRGARLAEVSDAPLPPSPDTSRIPATVGPAVDPPLVADLDGDGINELLLYREARVQVYRYDRQHGLVAKESYPSDGAPALADLDGDGRPELIVGSASATANPVIRAIQPAKGGRTLWETTLPRPDRSGMPYGRPLYFQTGRFTGKRTGDVYVYAGTPVVRSLMLDGRTGALLWEKGEVPGTERYFAPTVNLAAVHDVNGDGCDDLVFTNPDYYCVASGPTGDLLAGPVIPSKTFNQPSQGLYTLPAILEEPGKEPTVCLVDGHYFMGVMTAHAHPRWYRLPEVGEARTAAEGFLQLPDGRWLIGFGRQNGRFACVEAATGKTRWELPINASASGVSACDIDGDGRQEFLFGTSHGDLYAVRDEDGRARVVWKKRLSASVGMPVVADVDGDGSSDILVVTGDGQLVLLCAR
jgi:VCBS repeat protein/FG-GAP repeat protein